MKALLIAAVLAATCTPTPVPEPEPQEPSDPSSASACGKACERWEQLGCDVAKPDEEGNTCVDVCEHTQLWGLVDLHPEDAATATSCP